MKSKIILILMLILILSLVVLVSLFMFDRITACLKTEKETERKLRGKNMAAMSCGSDSIKHEGFFFPFEKSANYLGMHYSGHIHTWIEEYDP